MDCDFVDNYYYYWSVAWQTPEPLCKPHEIPKFVHQLLNEIYAELGDIDKQRRLKREAG
jgi:hypothetical protein